jgi:hypothetical protein
MKEFVEYFENFSKQFDLILKIEKSKYIDWEVRIFKRGYDMPFVRVKDKDINKAFELAKGLMVMSLYVS